MTPGDFDESPPTRAELDAGVRESYDQLKRHMEAKMRQPGAIHTEAHVPQVFRVITDDENRSDFDRYVKPFYEPSSDAQPHRGTPV